MNLADILNNLKTGQEVYFSNAQIRTRPVQAQYDYQGGLHVVRMKRNYDFRTPPSLWEKVRGKYVPHCLMILGVERWEEINDNHVWGNATGASSSFSLDIKALKDYKVQDVKQ